MAKPQKRPKPRWKRASSEPSPKLVPRTPTSMKFDDLKSGRDGATVVFRVSAWPPGAGVALQYLSPRVTLLIFAAAVSLGTLAASPLLVRPPAR